MYGTKIFRVTERPALWRRYDGGASSAAATVRAHFSASCTCSPWTGSAGSSPLAVGTARAAALAVALAATPLSLSLSSAAPLKFLPTPVSRSSRDRCLGLTAGPS